MTGTSPDIPYVPQESLPIKSNALFFTVKTGIILSVAKLFKKGFFVEKLLIKFARSVNKSRLRLM